MGAKFSAALQALADRETATEVEFWEKQNIKMARPLWDTPRPMGSRGWSRASTAGCMESMRQVEPIVEEGRVWKKTGQLVIAQQRAIA